MKEVAAVSRSRRKTPIMGVTSAASDRRFKDTEHRRERRAVKRTVRILHGDDDELEFPHRQLFGNAWASDKDGKCWVGWSRPETMRK